MKLKFTILLSLTFILYFALTANAQNKVGIFDNHVDVGTNVKPG